MKGMLGGIRVVELGTMVAVPLNAVQLSDWGAEVIKVEPVEGELGRSLQRVLGVDTTLNYPTGSFSWMFEQLNRGKKDVAVDLKQKEGRDIVYKLLATADIFLTNYMAGAVDRMGMDYETLRQINPRLIYGIVTGYGLVGPDKDQRGFDYSAAWARSGMMHMTRQPGMPPGMQRPGQFDALVGSNLIAGVLGALWLREKTGIGQMVHSALYRSAVWSMHADYAAALAGRPLPIDDRSKAANPLFNPYRTKDDRWLELVMLRDGAYWPNFCTAIGRPELPSDPRFLTMDLRQEHCAELVMIIDEEMAKHTMAEWEEILRKHDCMYGRAQTVTEVIDDPQAAVNGFFGEIEHPVAGSYRVTLNPLELSETPPRPQCAAPTLGQDNEDILVELGYSWSDIATLKDNRVIP